MVETMKSNEHLITNLQRINAYFTHPIFPTYQLNFIFIDYLILSEICAKLQRDNIKWKCTSSLLSSVLPSPAALASFKRGDVLMLA